MEDVTKKNSVQPKVGVTKNELFVGFNKESGTYYVSTVSSSKEIAWDKIYYKIEKGNTQAKRELAKKLLGGKWEVVGFQGIFPFKGVFTE